MLVMTRRAMPAVITAVNTQFLARKYRLDLMCPTADHDAGRAAGRPNQRPVSEESQRNISVLLRRKGLTLTAQRAQRARHLGASLGRADDRIDVTTVGSDVRI